MEREYYSGEQITVDLNGENYHAIGRQTSLSAIGLLIEKMHKVHGQSI